MDAVRRLLPLDGARGTSRPQRFAPQFPILVQCGVAPGLNLPRLKARDSRAASAEADKVRRDVRLRAPVETTGGGVLAIRAVAEQSIAWDAGPFGPPEGFA